MLKATMVDGVYNCDPKKNPDAKRYDKLTYSKFLAEKLAVMDATAAALCMDNNMPTLVFSLDNADNIVKAVKGENIGTLVTN
jgi:uridylate kinase